MYTRDLFNKERRYVEKYIVNFYKKAPITNEYKAHTDSHLFYLIPVMNLMSKYLEDTICVDNEASDLVYLKKLAIACFWIINKYEDDIPIDFIDIQSYTRILTLRQLESLEMSVLKKIDYRVSDYIPNNKNAYKKEKKNVVRDILTPPHKLQLVKYGGKPPLYVKPRSSSIDYGFIEPPPPPTLKEEIIRSKKRPRSMTY